MDNHQSKKAVGLEFTIKVSNLKWNTLREVIIVIMETISSWLLIPYMLSIIKLMCFKII